MTKFLSRRGALGIAVEATRGTPVVPSYWLPWATISFNDTVTNVAENEGLGNIADQDSFFVTYQQGEGNVDAQLYDSALGYILSSLLGAKPSTAGSYTHTFTMSQTNQPVTLSLFWKDPDRSYIFPMAVVESLKVSIAPGGLVNYTIGFKSKAARDWTAQTPSFTALGNKFLHQNLQYRLATTIAGLAGASETVLKSFDMTIDRNSIFDTTLGTVEPNDILSQEMNITGNLGLNLLDDTFRNYMKAGTYMAMEFYLYSSATSNLKMQFPRVSFSAWDPTYTLKDIAQQKVQFKANYDAANALDIISTCVLNNAHIAY